MDLKGMEELIRKLPLGVLVLDGEGRVMLSSDFLLDRKIVSHDYRGKKYYEVIRSLEVITAAGEILEGIRVEKKVKIGERTYLVRGLPREKSLLIEDISYEALTEKALREFAGAVSHELATPLTAIKGILESVISRKTGEMELLERALKRVTELEKMVDSVRTLVMVDSPAVEVEEIDLESIFNSVIDDLKDSIEKKRINISMGVQGISLKGSRERLYILFRNILDNAVKFNKEGGDIRIQSEIVDGEISIIIEDTGSGIPKGKIPYLFRPFVGREGGMGLGLAISQKIVKSMGGEIRIVSREGVGTRVILQFPNRPQTYSQNP